MSEQRPSDPTVQLVQDPAETDRILIAVSCSIVGFAVFAVAAFFYFRRKQLRSGVQVAGSIFPPIQPGITRSSLNLERDLISNHVNTESGPQTSHAGAEIPGSLKDQNDEYPKVPKAHGSSLDDLLREQANKKKLFQTRQSTFREQRDEKRRKASSPSSPSFEPDTSVLPDPVLKEEREIYAQMVRSRSKPIASKTVIYKQMLKRWHPDKCLGDVALAKSVFQFIQGRKSWYLDSEASS